MRGAREEACSTWEAALSRYRAGKSSGRISGDRVSTPGFNNMGEVVEAYLHKDCPEAGQSQGAAG